MATSQIRKTDLVIRPAGNITGNGGQTVRIPLTKEGLLSEHRINVSVSQANTGTDPTAVDPRKFIDSIELLTTDGKRFTGNGYLAYDLHRLTETIAATKFTLGATSTAEFSFELHHEMDGAMHDLLTAIRGGEQGQLDLVIKFAADTDNGFIGQTSGGVASYTVAVSERNYPAMAHQAGVGVLRQFVEQQSVPVSTTGRQSDIRLTGDNSTRFVLVHAHDLTNAVESDAVIDSVSLVIRGEEKRVVSWREMRAAAAARGVDATGFGLLDWGDDESGFLNLMGVNDPRITWSVATGAPASARVDFGQVSIKP